MLSLPTVLASPVVAALIALFAFAPPLIAFEIRRKRKIIASITLIYRYAEISRERLNSLNHDETKRRILQGDPFGEPRKDHTPMLAHATSDRLSFEQISEIFGHVNKDIQKNLLAYFADQAQVNSLMEQVINSDYFRSLTQDRKAFVWDIFGKCAENLAQKTNALMAVLEKQYPGKFKIQREPADSDHEDPSDK